jgi:predicted transposase YbfD/YdcC
VAALRGAQGVAAIGETAAELGQDELARLGSRRSPTTGCYRAPCTKTIRRVLKEVDADAVDKVVCGWVAEQIEVATDPFDIASVVAVDGKSLRGARLDGGQRVHLLSAFDCATGATIAQRGVAEKANEISGFEPLIADLDVRGRIFTADSMHTQRKLATCLTSRNAHYIFGVKANQSRLLKQAKALLEGVDVAFETSDRGHDRTEERALRAADLPAGSDFAGAAQVVAIERIRYNLAGWLLSKDTSYYITSLTAEQASPELLAAHIRAHSQGSRSASFA